MIIKRAALQAALAATTSTDTRYFLNSIRVEPEQHRLVATDGNILLIVTDASPDPDEDFPMVPAGEYRGDPPEPVCIPADVVKAMIATMPKRSTIPILGCAQLSQGTEAGTATITATDLQAPRTAIIRASEQGQFPAYERCLPKADRPSARVCLAVDVLENLIKAAKAVTQGRRMATITFDVPTGAADREKAPITTNAEGEKITGEPGAVTSAVGITITGDDLTITGCAMPVRE